MHHCCYYLNVYVHAGPEITIGGLANEETKSFSTTYFPFVIADVNNNNNNNYYYHHHHHIHAHV
jgi:hypothetical protein